MQRDPYGAYRIPSLRGLPRPDRLKKIWGNSRKPVAEYAARQDSSCVAVASLPTHVRPHADIYGEGITVVVPLVSYP